MKYYIEKQIIIRFVNVPVLTRGARVSGVTPVATFY